MAKTLVCDGCGEVQPISEKEGWGFAGLIEQRDYCSGCLEKADEYMRRRDEIHDETAVAWKDRMSDLDVKFKEGLRVLPV